MRQRAETSFLRHSAPRKIRLPTSLFHTQDPILLTPVAEPGSGGVRPGMSWCCGVPLLLISKVSTEMSISDTCPTCGRPHHRLAGLWEHTAQPCPRFTRDTRTPGRGQTQGQATPTAPRGGRLFLSLSGASDRPRAYGSPRQHDPQMRPPVCS